MGFIKKQSTTKRLINILLLAALGAVALYFVGQVMVYYGIWEINPILPVNA